jgi:hypothetical protein
LLLVVWISVHAPGLNSCHRQRLVLEHELRPALDFRVQVVKMGSPNLLQHA